jgi:hypothetical protein
MSNKSLPLSLTNAKDSFFSILFQKHPAEFDHIMKDLGQFGVQVIFTQIDRNRKGKPTFTDHYFNVDTARYFYPASTVKLPIAILALQRLNELKIPGLDKYSTMITETEGDSQTPVYTDASAPESRPCIAHYIKKILLVSDNDAYNRLYEFLGQEYINSSLHKMGYSDVQIIHRLEISLNEEQNRNTNPVKFYDSSGRLLYEKPAARSSLIYASRNTKMGKGFYRGGQLVNEPFDFSKKNRISLEDLHLILRSVIFPDAVPVQQRFGLTPGDYAFLRRCMSMTPPESKSPVYTKPDYWDTYVKFILYGAEKEKMEPGIRVFNKPGDAYGFMLDIAYVADFTHNTEFMVSAVIHCNSDGIFNDDKYEYDSIAKPFMKNLGHMLLDYERSRQKKFQPDLSGFRFDYSK